MKIAQKIFNKVDNLIKAKSIAYDRLERQSRWTEADDVEAEIGGLCEALRIIKKVGGDMKKILIILFLMLAQPVQAQSVDSLWGLRSVRSFTDNHSKWIGGSLVAVALVAQGANNGYFYGGSNRKGIKNLHSIQDVITYSTAGLGYVAGLDAMEASGLNLMVNVAFKGMINVALGQPFINRNEPDTYESFGWERGKLFHGRGRYAQAAVGATMLFYKPIIRKIKKVFR